MSLRGVAECLSFKCSPPPMLKRQAAFVDGDSRYKRRRSVAARRIQGAYRSYRSKSYGRSRFGRGYGGVMVKAYPRRFCTTTFRPELKHIALSNVLGFFGLGNTGTTNDGFYVAEMDWSMTQGDTSASVEGTKVQCQKIRSRIKIEQQANCTNNVSFKIYVVRVVGNPLTFDTQLSDGAYAGPPGANDIISVNKFLYDDPINGLVDVFSVRNEDTYQNFRVLKTWSGTVGSDQITGQTNRVDIHEEYPAHFQRSRAVSDSGVIAGQVFILFVANEGDCVAATATGLAIQQVHTLYYTDY